MNTKNVQNSHHESLFFMYHLLLENNLLEVKMMMIRMMTGVSSEQRLRLPNNRLLNKNDTNCIKVKDETNDHLVLSLSCSSHPLKTWWTAGCVSPSCLSHHHHHLQSAEGEWKEKQSDKCSVHDLLFTEYLVKRSLWGGRGFYSGFFSGRETETERERERNTRPNAQTDTFSCSRPRIHFVIDSLFFDSQGETCDCNFVSRGTKKWRTHRGYNNCLIDTRNQVKVQVCKTETTQRTTPLEMREK